MRLLVKSNNHSLGQSNMHQAVTADTKNGNTKAIPALLAKGVDLIQMALGRKQI